MNLKIKYISAFMIGALALTSTSCRKDLLNQESRVELPESYFWKTTDDAVSSIYSVYEATRTLFGRDYYFDGQGEFQWTRGTSLGSGSWGPGGGAGSGFGYMWNNAYRVINRSNYVLDNTSRMLAKESNPSSKAILERVDAEARFLRALAYFRLISLWGDVPYFTNVLLGNEEAVKAERMPIGQIKDAIIADLTKAVDALPPNIAAAEKGRASKAAAYAFRGKVQLFWASWKKNGWPELKGFTQDAAEATQYYTKAAADFHHVINDFGLTLFAEGNPGTHAQPKYWDLFQYFNQDAPEIIFGVRYGGPNLGQGHEMQRDFGTRSTGDAQCWIMPTNRLADRYQSVLTGDFVAPLTLGGNASTPNGALNTASYSNRDIRMKATMLWDNQKMLKISPSGYEVQDSITFKFGNRDGINFINYDVNGGTGYIFRKWVRQDGIAPRSDGPGTFYLMRLADVYLMYAEAKNEVSGPDNELVGLVNKVRARGLLPGLASAKYASPTAFFDAIEQERIVELVAEGQRPFDLRRWRKAETVWPAPGGQILYGTTNVQVRDEFRNGNPRDYQRFYIYQIPPAERERNPKIEQNEPWL